MAVPLLEQCKGIKILSLFHFIRKKAKIFRGKNGFQEDNYYLIHAFATNAIRVS
jgi:hypothetical protein